MSLKTRKVEVIFLALLIDLLLGELPTRFHPVAWMGAIIAKAERRAPRDSRLHSFAYGALIAGGGVDLFILETFSSVPEILAAIAAVRSVSALPILAQMTVGENQQTIYGETPAMIVKELEGQPVQAVGLNCSVGPAVILECMEQSHAIHQIPQQYALCLPVALHLLFRPSATTVSTVERN